MDISNNVEQLVASLSLEEKVGQLFILAFAGNDKDYALELVKDHNVAGFYITDDNASSTAEAKQLAQQLQQQASLRACDAPLLLAVDQEGAWGILTHQTDLGPGNLALGQVDNPALTREMYQVFAEQMQALGYNALLSPCADVNSNPDNPIIGLRAFGEAPEKVAKQVAAAVSGIAQTGNLSCAKHFPGHGDTDSDSHRELPQIDKPLSALLASDLVPFQAAIEAGVSMIMTSHICYPQLDPDNPATLSKRILTDLLKQQLGFNGLIITDSMNMWAMRKNYQPADAAVKALAAGAHLVMLSEEHYENQITDYKQLQKETIQGVVTAVRQGELAEAVIDSAVKHVLCFKYARLSKVNKPAKLSAAESQLLAKIAAKRAIKVLRNHNKQFPIGDKPFYLAFASDPKNYDRIVNSRGIGPNDPIPASEYFCQRLDELDANYQLLSFEQLQQVLKGEQNLIKDKPLVLVSEDYPLPGESFDLAEQQKRVEQASALFEQSLLVLGLRSDYEFSLLPQSTTYVCAYSSRKVSAYALAELLIDLT